LVTIKPTIKTISANKNFYDTEPFSRNKQKFASHEDALFYSKAKMAVMVTKDQILQYHNKLNFKCYKEYYLCEKFYNWFENGPIFCTMLPY